MHLYRRNTISSRLMKRLLIFSTCFSCLFSSLSVNATTAEEEAELRKNISIESNLRKSWPEGPIVSAESAILMDVSTGAILYEKNIHEELYPASITKILTCLVAIEHMKSLDEEVQVSREAVYTVPRDGTNIGLDEGQSLSFEDCLYGILMKSANEACNAIGEHVAGSIDGFVDLMNEKANELGCQNSHFVTTNGLHDENHYTSAYDMALIGRAFFSNELLCKISGTKYHQIPQTETQPDLIDMYATNKLLPGKEFSYDYIVGSKTGFTSLSKQTLVSCAEKNGMKLVCVVLKEDSPSQFTDTISLFEYGFNHFSLERITDVDKHYTIDTSDFFQSDTDIFGSSKQFVSLDPNAMVLVPDTISFHDLSSSLEYNHENNSVIATISYFYDDIPLGNCNLLLDHTEEPNIVFDSLPASQISDEPTDSNSNNASSAIFIDIYPILIFVGIIIIFIFLFFFIRRCLINIHFNKDSKHHFFDSLREKKRIRSKRRDAIKRNKKRISKVPTKVSDHKSIKLSFKRSSRPSRKKVDRSSSTYYIGGTPCVSRKTRSQWKRNRHKRKRKNNFDVRIHFNNNDLPHDL